MQDFASQRPVARIAEGARGRRGRAWKARGRAGLALLVVALMGLALSSCGGGGHTDASTVASPATSTSGAPSSGAADSTRRSSTTGQKRAGAAASKAGGTAAGVAAAGTNSSGSAGTGSASTGASKDPPGAHLPARADPRHGTQSHPRAKGAPKSSAAVPPAGAGAPPSGTSTAPGAMGETYEVRSLNMEPTYKPYAKVYYDPKDTSPTDDQVVVFHLPTGSIEGSCGDNPPPGHACQEAAPGLSETLALGRVVALGGEAVAFQEGNVIRNGRQQEEPFTKACGSGPVCTFADPITVPSGSYYIAYDNRSQLDDSRVWGAVPQAAIVGVVNGVAGSS
jgi:signal peptidase I